MKNLTRKEKQKQKYFNLCKSDYELYKHCKGLNNVGRSIFFRTDTDIGVGIFILIVANIFLWSIILNQKFIWWGKLISGLFLILICFLVLKVIIPAIQKWNIYKQFMHYHVSDFDFEMRRTVDGTNFYILRYSLTTPITGFVQYQDDISEKIYLILAQLKTLPVYLSISNNCYEYQIDYKKIKKDHKENNLN